MTEEEKRQKHNEQSRRWRAKNKELFREINRRYRDENREKVREIGRKWQREHKQQKNKTTSKWRAANPLKVKSYSAVHRMTEEERLLLKAYLSRADIKRRLHGYRIEEDGKIMEKRPVPKEVIILEYWEKVKETRRQKRIKQYNNEHKGN